MVSSINENVDTKFCNIVTNLCDSICSGLEDKPFGSEMCYGRGVCDTDPIRKYNEKLCSVENNAFAISTMSINNIALNGYFADKRQSLLIDEDDFEKEVEIKKQFLRDLITDFSPCGMKLLVDSILRDLKNVCCEESKLEMKKELVDPCERNSSQESSKTDPSEASIMSIQSPIERNNFYIDSKTLHRVRLGKSSPKKDNKPVGPFTEPPNPGKQMKLGKPYHVHSPVDKDFYKDF